ncbi:alpha/beta hydrolase family protein [Kitasatospora sp. NPDC004745]|uniref:alpha/beta hydrolase family protein n=1 Tax=Kitasatospora sp. NPDC004745 TaxID=3364019 RepID=UPI00367CDDCD
MTSIRPEVVPYADGRLMDVHRPPAGAAGPAPVVLLWHGRGADERDVLRPLAREAAALGLLVFVPDWRSDGPDGGRAELLASLACARREAAAHGGDPERLVLAGWSLGGREAVAVATRPDTSGGTRPVAAVGISSSYARPSAVTGDAPLDRLAAAPSPVPVWLVHGTEDEVVGPEHTRKLAEALPAAVLLELPTDHAGVVMTAYDAGAGRCLPTDDPGVLHAGRRTAAVLAEAAGLR